VKVRPGDEIAARARAYGHLRASNADRDRVIDTLKAAFVQGYVTKDEFDARVSQALGSRTYAELSRVTADLPTDLAAAQPPSRPARATGRPQTGMRPASRDGVFVATAVLACMAWAVAAVAIIPLAALLAIVSGMVSLCMGGAHLLSSRRNRRSRGQLPQRRAMNA
jgi:Flp pilus assembly protein TadB